MLIRGHLNSEGSFAEQIASWFFNQTGAPPETRVYMIPEIDRYGSFYLFGNWLPPDFWTPKHPWFQSVDRISERFIASMEHDPPKYIVVFPYLRDPSTTPEFLWDYLYAQYESMNVDPIPPPFPDHAEIWCRKTLAFC